MLTARFPLPASPTSWGRWREAPEGPSLPGARQGLPDIVDVSGIDAAGLGDALDDGLRARAHVLVFGKLGHVTLSMKRAG